MDSSSTDQHLIHRPLRQRETLLTINSPPTLPGALLNFQYLWQKEDGIKSLASVEFPVTLEQAIESYLETKYENKRRTREGSFRLLEIEAVVRRQMDLKNGKSDDMDIQGYMTSKDVIGHLDSLDTPHYFYIQKRLL